MKLLFITQVVDKEDDVLGVYHKWIEELARYFESIKVIALQKGDVALPENVEVYSLGKEEKSSKLEKLRRYYKYIIKLRDEYDAVFVHMNPEFVILGGWLWKILGKRVVFWYAHYYPNPLIRISQIFVDAVTTSNKFAYPLKLHKLKVLSQGIDVELFKKGLKRSAVGGFKEFKILFLGRISPVKDLETLIYATSELRKKNERFHLTIVGAPTVRDKNYFEKIERLVSSLEMKNYVTFYGNVPNIKTPQIYCQADLFVNLTRTGSFDKSILEAMACEVPVLVCNRAYEEIFPKDLKNELIFREKEADDLMRKIALIMKKPQTERERIGKILREIVVREHNLVDLVRKISRVLENKYDRNK